MDGSLSGLSLADLPGRKNLRTLLDLRETSIHVSKAKHGRRGWTRTSDPQLRRLMLYPPELRARVSTILPCCRAGQNMAPPLPTAASPPRPALPPARRARPVAGS